MKVTTKIAIALGTNLGDREKHLADAIAALSEDVLWETAQSMPEYRDTTTLVLTTDHGRGAGLENWKTHGKAIPESREWWTAAMGPDTPALGERGNVAPVVQAQIAATIAKFLGEDFRVAVPEAAEAIGEFFAE